MIRSIARSIRHAPDRLRHSSRHAVARESVAAHPGGRILFVCHGNICRSPYAEHALLRDLADVDPDRWRVESAGFIEPGRPSPAEAVAAAGRRGVNLDAHRSRLLTRENVALADLIYVMSVSQAGEVRARFGAPADRVWVLGDLDPRPILKRTIRDPVDQPEAVFETVYDRIDRCIRVIVEAKGRSGT